MNLNTPEIRVVIVADDPLARAGLAAMLDAMDGCVAEGQLSVEEAQPESLADWKCQDACLACRLKRAGIL